jgi:hypothetical protein
MLLAYQTEREEILEVGKKYPKAVRHPFNPLAKYGMPWLTSLPAINFRSIWDNAADDDAAMKVDSEFMAKLEKAARKWNSLLPNQWMNNAAQDVDVIGSYGEDNVKKLRKVSEKYDPEQTFQNLCSGGYKLARVPGRAFREEL